MEPIVCMYVVYISICVYVYKWNPSNMDTN